MWRCWELPTAPINCGLCCVRTLSESFLLFTASDFYPNITTSAVTICLPNSHHYRPQAGGMTEKEREWENFVAKLILILHPCNQVKHCACNTNLSHKHSYLSTGYRSSTGGVNIAALGLQLSQALLEPGTLLFTQREQLGSHSSKCKFCQHSFSHAGVSHKPAHVPPMTTTEDNKLLLWSKLH